MPAAPPALDSSVLPLLEQAIAGSPADATEIAWVEVRRGEEGGERRRDDERLELSVLVRVRVSGRTGLHSTGAVEVADLESAVRSAMAQARLAAPSAAPPLAPPPVAETVAASALWDPEIDRLSPDRARDWLHRTIGREGAPRLAWASGRVAVAHSAGLRRAASATAVTLAVRYGGGAGAGQAATAARSLRDLPVEATLERARRRHAEAATAEPPAQGGPGPLVLSELAAATLLEALNRSALSAAAFSGGTSPFRDRSAAVRLSPALTLTDDATSPLGLPFPFDLFGWSKRPIELIAAGEVVSPAIDDPLALELGRPSTPHRVAADESIASHLILAPGTADETALLTAAEGGLFLGALARCEVFAAHPLRFRAVARGVRRIAQGALAEAVPDLLWEDRLTDVLARVLAVGAAAVPIATADPFF
ncbi:MAG TPA: metallopeptidase TldD-related protein, partial [Thermoanaerobaculia bacterium]